MNKKQKSFIQKIIYILSGISFITAIILAVIFNITCHKKADYSNIFIDVNSEKYVEPVIVNSDGESIDFNELRSENDAVYGYIDVAGTNIKSAVIRSDNPCGLLYTGSNNTKKFSERNVVVFADADIFTDIVKYQNTQYFTGHSDVKASSLEADLKYEIFASAVFDDVDIVENYDFTSYSGLKSYLEDVKKNSFYYDDSVLTDSKSQLITFSGKMDDGRRIIVLAVKVDE